MELVALIIVVVMVALAVIWKRPDPPVLQDDGPGDSDDVGRIEIEDAIDLHGFQPKEIPSVVESYLEAAIEEGICEVRLIHGRGKGVQRRRVQQLLEEHPLVESYRDASAHRGGWGATIAVLRIEPQADDR